MKRIVWDEPERVMRFVALRTEENEYFGYTAIGLESDGELRAGVVYNQKTDVSIHAHIASDGSRHCITPYFLSAIFRYPFIQEKCQRITGLVRSDNLEARRFDEHLGFKREGVIRKGCADGTDLILYGMLKEECKFLDGKYHESLLRHCGFADKCFQKALIQ